MKFGHEFQEALRTEDYPAHWIDSAIAYRQLKKCIKKVQYELSSLGLDAHTLNQLLQAVENGSSSKLAPFQYSFAGDANALSPRLVFIIDTKDGIPINAGLSPTTRKYLESLALSQTLSHCRISEIQAPSDGQFLDADASSTPEQFCVETNDERYPLSSDESSLSLDDFGLERVADLDGIPRQIEIPLTSDSEFFNLLKNEISTLDALQAQEQTSVTHEVVELGKEVAIVAAPSRTLSRTDLYHWREIFDIYAQANIFFSTNEEDHGSRTSEKAQKQMEWFLNELNRMKVLKQFKRKESPAILNQFIQINMGLLRNLRFQEINHLAMSKILKKFDKRTALGAKNTFPELVATDSFLASNMAKAVCFTVNEELLTIVPQLNDYLCPICFSISFKPVRLMCSHVFCIRCMITLQRSRDKHCPMCREDVVLDADSTNLDAALMNFLKIYFPKEVKAKQKENERLVAIEQYGPGAATGCTVM